MYVDYGSEGGIPTQEWIRISLMSTDAQRTLFLRVQADSSGFVCPYQCAADADRSQDDNFAALPAHNSYRGCN